MERNLSADLALNEIEMASIALRMVLDDNEAALNGMIENEKIRDVLLEYNMAQAFLNNVIMKSVTALQEVVEHE